MQKGHILLLAAVITVMVSGYVFGAPLLKKSNLKTPFVSGEVSILLTKNGFEPPLLKVNRGEKVTFVSDTGDMFWPASNQHPSHGDWSDFDPKRPLDPQESWSFMFDRVGNWNYHDHLNPKNRGTIEVVGNDGKSAEECLKRGEGERQSVQAKCWEGEFREVILKTGLSGAFTLLEEYLQDPLFATNCHDVTHVIGEVAYRKYSETGETVSKLNSSVCGFGFYHGFVEEMMRLEGQYDNAKLYCDTISLDTTSSTISMIENARSACYHGIGHALFDSLPTGEFWGDGHKMANAGLAECEKLFFSETTRVSCFSGVANALAIAYNNSYYGLSFNLREHFKVCNDLPDIYAPYCFVEVGTHYGNYKQLSFEDAMAVFAAEIPESSMPNMVESYSLQVTQRKDNNASSVRESANLCKNLSDIEWLPYCFLGTVSGFVRVAKEEEFIDLALNFCQEFDDSNFRLCLSKTVAALRPFLSDSSMSNLCQEIEGRLQMSCDNLKN